MVTDMAMVTGTASLKKTMTKAARASLRSNDKGTALKPLRISLLVMAAIIMWQSARYSFAAVSKVSNPAAALAAVPGEPTATAVFADALLVKSTSGPPSKIDCTKAESFARMSLQDQALNPRALRILSFAACDVQSPTKLRLTAELAVKASRRESGAHIWLIEDYVSRDDIQGALKHYDLALSTSPESAKILIPTLIQASSDPQIRSALAPYVKRQRPWFNQFFLDALMKNSDPVSLARLIESADRWPKDNVFDDLVGNLLTKLVTAGNIPDAKRLYLRRSGAVPRLMTSAEITPESFSSAQLPFAWQALGSPSVGLSTAGNAASGAGILVFAAPNERAVVGRKLLLLGSGTYALSFAVGDVRLSGGGSLKLTLSCLSGTGSTVAWTQSYNQIDSNTSVRADVQIPPGCAAQNLDLEMAGGESQQGSEMSINRIALTAVRPSAPNSSDQKSAP
jgi:hypothetical protein